MELVAASRAGAVRVVDEARLRVTVRTEAALPRGAVPPKAPAWSIAETLRNAIKPLRIAIPEIRAVAIPTVNEIESDAGDEKDNGDGEEEEDEEEEEEDEEGDARQRRRGRAAAVAAAAATAIAPVVAAFTLNWPDARAADVARVTAAWQGLSFLVPNVRERLVAAVANEGAEERADATAPFKVSGAEWERREAGERPDTVHVERLPIHWFAPATGAATADALAAVARTASGATVVWGAGVAGVPAGTQLPDPEVVEAAFGQFGPVQRVRLEPLAVGAVTVDFAVWVQYKTEAGCRAALEALAGRALAVAGAKTFPLRVSLDRKGTLTDNAVRRAKFEEERRRQRAREDEQRRVAEAERQRREAAEAAERAARAAEAEARRKAEEEAERERLEAERREREEAEAEERRKRAEEDRRKRTEEERHKRAEEERHKRAEEERQLRADEERRSSTRAEEERRTRESEASRAPAARTSARRSPVRSPPRRRRSPSRSRSPSSRSSSSSSSGSSSSSETSASSRASASPPPAAAAASAKDVGGRKRARSRSPEEAADRHRRRDSLDAEAEADDFVPRAGMPRSTIVVPASNSRLLGLAKEHDLRDRLAQRRAAAAPL